MAAALGLHRRRFPLWPLVAAAAIVALLGIAFVFRNQEHVDTKHASAALVRDAHRRGTCVAIEAYFSPPRGTVLVLCELDAERTGGMVFRFTANNGTEFLGGEAREATCYVRARSYWNNVIIRDGYWLLSGYVDVEAKFWAWFHANL